MDLILSTYEGDPIAKAINDHIAPMHALMKRFQETMSREQFLMHYEVREVARIIIIYPRMS